MRRTPLDRVDYQLSVSDSTYIIIGALSRRKMSHIENLNT